LRKGEVRKEMGGREREVREGIENVKKGKKGVGRKGE
jgi:hypothetical protein